MIGEDSVILTMKIRKYNKAYILSLSEKDDSSPPAPPAPSFAIARLNLTLCILSVGRAAALAFRTKELQMNGEDSVILTMKIRK